jgi:hypothetical protein
MMNYLEETTSRRALLAMALSSAGAMAFPINIKQDKTSQDANVEAAKRFVGTWKGKSRPDMIADNVLVFKMEGERLKGTERQLNIRDERDGRGPQIVRDEYVPLPDLRVEGKTLTWKTKWIQPDQEALRRVTLISDDEILFETVGINRSTGQPTLIVPISYKLKREK